MTGLEIVLLVALAYVAGALVCVLTASDVDLNGREYVALAGWFIWIPFALTVRTYRRRRATRRTCGRRRADREALLAHQAKNPGGACRDTD